MRNFARTTLVLIGAGAVVGGVLGAAALLYEQDAAAQGVGKIGELRIHTDVETGCLYLSLEGGYFLTPRLRTDGSQMCVEDAE